MSPIFIVIETKVFRETSIESVELRRVVTTLRLPE